MVSEFNQSSSLQEIVTSLRTGQKWIIEGFRDWLKTGDFSEQHRQKFDAGMDRWEMLENVFRTTGATECIWGQGKKCPLDSPVCCAACEGPAEAAEPQMF